VVSEHPHKYNGKELNEELGLDWYDYGSRNYDASLGRWMNIDPLAEDYFKKTPYMYAGNNPVIFVDYDGRDYGVAVDHDKKTVAISAE
jgi:RHS repeat-associated protein